MRESAYCTNNGANALDCCTGAYDACTTTMFSVCIDYTASQTGACSSTGLGTMCW